MEQQVAREVEVEHHEKHHGRCQAHPEPTDQRRAGRQLRERHETGEHRGARNRHCFEIPPAGGRRSFKPFPKQPGQDSDVSQPGDLVNRHENQKRTQHQRQCAQSARARTGMCQHRHCYSIRHKRRTSTANDHESAVRVVATAIAASGAGTMGASATLSPTI